MVSAILKCFKTENATSKNTLFWLDTYAHHAYSKANVYYRKKSPRKQSN